MSDKFRQEVHTMIGQELINAHPNNALMVAHEHFVVLGQLAGALAGMIEHLTIDASGKNPLEGLFNGEHTIASAYEGCLLEAFNSGKKTLFDAAKYVAN